MLRENNEYTAISSTKDAAQSLVGYRICWDSPTEGLTAGLHSKGSPCFVPPMWALSSNPTSSNRHYRPQQHRHPFSCFTCSLYFRASCLSNVVSLCIEQLAADLERLGDFDARVNHMISSLVSAGVVAAESTSDLHQAVISFGRKMLILYDYRPSSILRASTRVTFVRASDSSVQVLGEDYGLHDVYDGDVDIHVLQGTHSSIITEPESTSRLARLIDTLLSG